MRKPHCAADVSASPAPVDCPDINPEFPEFIADRPVGTKEYHGKPVTMRIQRVLEILDDPGDAARLLLTGSKNVDDVNAMAQARGATMLRTLSSTLFP